MTASVQRQVRFGWQDRLPRIFFWLLGLLSLPGMHFYGQAHAETLRRMSSEGIVAEATVRGSAVRRRSRGPNRWEVRLELEAAGETHHLTRTIIGGRERPIPGDPLTVTYLPSAPEKARVGKVTADMAASTARVSTWIGAAISLFAAGVGLAMHFWQRHPLRLLRTAPLVLGRVEGLTDRRMSSSLAVAFEWPEGRRHVCAFQIPHKLARGLSEGDSIELLVDEEEPGRSELRSVLERRVAGRLAPDAATPSP